MPLDATTSGVAANSYLGDAQFIAYGEGSLASSRLAASTPVTRERALRTATRMLDRLSYSGTASSYTQALQWPRLDVADPDRVPNILLSTLVPRRVIEASAELAIALLGEGELSPDGTLPKSATLQRAKVDVIEVEYREGGVAAATDARGVLQRYPAVWSLIEPLLAAPVVISLTVARA